MAVYKDEAKGTAVGMGDHAEEGIQTGYDLRQLLRAV